jgi:hypothetical protein
MQDAATQIVSATIGKTLIAACRADYLIDGVPNDEELGPLELEFNDGSTVVLSLVHNGIDVTSDSTPLIFSSDTWFRIDLTGEEEFQRIIGLKVTRCDQWIWDGEARTGWRFWFDEQTLCYLNAGDDAKIEINTSPLFPAIGCHWQVIAGPEMGR